MDEINHKRSSMSGKWVWNFLLRKMYLIFHFSLVYIKWYINKSYIIGPVHEDADHPSLPRQVAPDICFGSFQGTSETGLSSITGLSSGNGMGFGNDTYKVSGNQEMTFVDRCMSSKFFLCTCIGGNFQIHIFFMCKLLFQ